MPKLKMTVKAWPVLFACFAVFSSCSSEKKADYTLMPREGAVSSPDAAATMADEFAGSGAVVPAGSPRPSHPRPRANADGSASLLDSGGKELVRFYSFQTGRGAERVSVTPEGYYRASPGGASLLTVKAGKDAYTLRQFAGALFRPDLLLNSIAAEDNGDNGGGRETLASLLAAKRPHRIQGGLGVRDGSLVLDLTVIEALEKPQAGGIGTLALFCRDSRGVEFPAALLDGERFVAAQYRKGGKSAYDISLSLPLEPEFSRYRYVGVSVFNKDNTAESERLWAELPAPAPAAPAAAPAASAPAAAAAPAAPAAGRPVLHALFASASGEPDPRLAEAFSRQESGAVYKAVRVYPLYGRALTKDAFRRSFEELGAVVGAEDVFVLFLSGPGAADERGNFRFYLSGDSYALGSRELAEALLSLKTHKVFVLLDTRSPQKSIEIETAFLRLKDWLGPGAFVGAGNPPQESREGSAAFTQALLEAAAGAWAGSSRFLGAAGFSLVLHKALVASGGAGALAAFPPEEDFPFMDRYYASGELRMQTMFSGSVLVEGFDARGQPLSFGETQARRLPPGNYAVTMTYRNGHRETKRAEVHNNRTEWLVFTYTPELSSGDFKGRLPSFGVNISELNPAGYKKTDILEQLDIPPYYAAFLSGEQSYRSGEYDKAIAEYTRCLSLKGDYTEAFVSRGNAWRRKGDADRAVSDYTRAITLQPDHAEAYNYRGYLYVRQGNHAKAIEDYSRALRLKSGYADAWFNRAYAYTETKEWDKAIADYTRVIQLEPSNAAAYKERAFAWANKGDPAKAAADYAAAARLGE
jgi:tetratricopeptide (TPR) repeat protein